MGTVTDKYGREVIIDEDGIRSVYKDPESGEHDISSANYEEVRGKRLPWIRHTVQNSDAVYVEEEPIGRSGIRRKYFYVATVTIKLQKSTRANLVLRRRRSRGEKSGAPPGDGVQY